VLVIAGPLQGVAGERPGLVGEVVEGLLQLVESLSLLAFLPPSVVFLIPLDGLQAIDEQGIHAAGPILGRDPTAPADGALQAGAAVAVNQSHGYYTPLLAPLGAIPTLLETVAGAHVHSTPRRRRARLSWLRPLGGDRRLH
jgi:hypothetical protein